MSQDAVGLHGLSKRFGDVAAVDDVTLAIRSNEFFSILGPSGCGKTTLMRMITGFEKPTAGRVELDGVDVSGRPPHKRDLNMLFQNYALFPHLSVRDNVAFELRVRHRPRKEIETAVADALALVRLTGFERRRPAELSGGQKQRVALARALVSQPAVVLLDEPLGALDAKLRLAMQLELKRLQREVGITFIYVTHDQGEALTMSDRIAVMSGGRVLQVDTPRGIYGRPATRFVADFIGTSNFLDGTVRDGRLDVPGVGSIPVPENSYGSGMRTSLAVRPESVRIGGVGCDVMIRARVKDVVFLGDETRVYVTAGDGSQHVVKCPSGALPDADNEVEIGWSLADSVLLAE
jgi:ABC-type Fe3+/spermidine/putrescine transport system ATPase subunit